MPGKRVGKLALTATVNDLVRAYGPAIRTLITAYDAAGIACSFEGKGVVGIYVFRPVARAGSGTCCQRTACSRELAVAESNHLLGRSTLAVGGNR